MNRNRLSGIIHDGKSLILTGPYGTEIAERVGRDIAERPQRAFGVPTNRYIGSGCSALLTEEGRRYIRAVALDYLTSVPTGQPLMLVTNSFRLAKQNLEAAATIRGVDPLLPAMGLELCLDSMNLASPFVVQESGRSIVNTVIAMSIGPPFDCYAGEATPPDIDNKYLPQVFAAVRFGHDLDFLMFETVPSLRAAIGAARAFKQAHDELDILQSKATFTRLGTITYMGDLLGQAVRLGNGAVHRLAPSYDSSAQAFSRLQPEKEYTISFCLEADGRLHGIPLNDAINELYRTIYDEGLCEPFGVGINCNSLWITTNALESLTSQNRARVISIHPNASLEDNPRRYADMTRQQAIATDVFAEQVVRLARDYQLQVIGGCCGTDAGTMKAMHARFSGNGFS